jgi:hypothetical protein
MIAWLAHPGLAQALLLLAILMAGLRNLPVFLEPRVCEVAASDPADPTA